MGLSIKEKNVPPQTDYLISTPRLEEKDFMVLSSLLLEESGISLSKSKRSMIESRLIRRLRANRLSSYHEYIGLIKTDKLEREEFINALTTNKTEFFRENNHFQFLVSRCLPEIKEKNKKESIRVWSAASSTGEELYTLGIVLNEFFENKKWDIRLLGSDLDTGVLEKAQMGIYAESVLRGIAPHLLQKYFLRGTDNNSGLYRVKDSLKALVKFRKFNLIKDEFPGGIKFDIIFLRNVLIYFKPDTIQIVIDKMYNMLDKGGHLFIGNSETLLNIDHKFKQISSSIYKKI